MDEEFMFNGMTPELKDYLECRKDLTLDTEVKQEKLNILISLLPQGLLDAYEKAQKIWMCRDVTAKEAPKITTSPSGKYQLHLTWHGTKPSSWSYTKGKVYEGERLIEEICRNYSSFPFLFVENHPKGDFLICGADYQGQTVVELKSGKRRDSLSDGTDKGFGFCWSEYKFDEKSSILVVDGCIWACPYEFRFFDFSDPIERGWPEIEIEDCIYTDKKLPEISEDGTLKCFKASDDEEDSSPEEIRSIKTFRREGLKFILVDEWKSDEEIENERKREENEKAYETWKTNFKANDPLYTTYKARLDDPKGLKISDHESIGQCYEGWCPDFFSPKEGKLERRWCRRIHEGKSKGYTIDLEWGMETGPIKLIIYKDGNNHKDEFFPHSTQGMNAAFDQAQTLINK
jgi:hypothetical protein